MAEESSLQTDLLEPLSAHIERIERFAPTFANQTLIVSTELDVDVFEENQGVTKAPIPWPLLDYKMFYIVDVPAGVTIPKHSHEESVFRILISGSLTVNGRKIDQPGTWYVVRALTEYEISTETGYRVLSGYTSNCRTGRERALQKQEAQEPSPPRG